MKPFKYLPQIVRVLLIANAVVFAAAFFLGSMLGLHVNLTREAGYANIADYITYYGAFFPTEPLAVWRYVTYMFIHIDFMHFFFNMLMLWMFGDEIAAWMGKKHFAGLYFFCGIFAALFSVGMCVLGLTNNPIIGASGALMGVFVAYYKFFPDRRILMFFFIPMKIKHAMWVMIALDVMFANTGDTIAHFAHLGGVVAGFIYMALYNNVFTRSSRQDWRRSPLGKIFRLFSAHPERYEDSSDSNGGRGGFGSYGADSNGCGSGSNDCDAGDDERPKVVEGEVFYVDEQKRMDEILKKVAREGLQSLTETERQFLLKAGERVRRHRGGF